MIFIDSHGYGSQTGAHTEGKVVDIDVYNPRVVHRKKYEVCQNSLIIAHQSPNLTLHQCVMCTIL